MKFERDPLIRARRERVPDDHEIIRKMYPEAEKMLKEASINPADFVDLYGEENVEKDLATVERLKKRFEHTGTDKTGQVLEAIMLEHIELSEWLGEHATTYKTSEYDDIVNKVDLVTEFDIPDSKVHLAMGVDVTFAHTFSEKFNEIRDEIDNDRLRSVKYFDSDSFKGSLKQVPRVVIGVDTATVSQLAYLWEENNKRKLGDHPVQHLILEEIAYQLSVFKEYARKKDKAEAYKTYTRALGIIKSIRAKKAAKEMDEHFNDVLQNVHSQLSLFGT